jgi:G3E family GTPase
VHAFVLRFAEPFAWPDFSEAIDVLLATCGERILRVKGLIAVEGEAGPRVVQCVQHMRYPVASLPEWPDDDHQSRLVFIVRALAATDRRKGLHHVLWGRQPVSQASR